MRRALLFIFAVTLLPVPAAAQAKTPTPTYRVQVDIDADDNMRTELASFIARELRALGDVTVVTQDPYYRVSVVALPSRTQGGELRGYLASVTASVPLSNYDPRGLLKMTFEDFTDEKWAEIQTFFEDQEEIVHHVLYSGSPTLKDLAERVVAGLDQQVIEKRRQLLQRLRDRAKRR